MAAVNEWIAREYFETQGFLVAQPVKHAGTGRRRRPEDDISLVVARPEARAHAIPETAVWRSADLAGVARAAVHVQGGHSDPLYPSTFEATPEIARFARPEARRGMARRFGTNEFAMILCVPRLPAAGETRDKCVARIRESGVDGIIEFDTLLGELIHSADIRKHYEKSDLLQILRLLKIYNLIAADQLELFAPSSRRRIRRPSASRQAATDTKADKTTPPSSAEACAAEEAKKA